MFRVFGATRQTDPRRTRTATAGTGAFEAEDNDIVINPPRGGGDDGGGAAGFFRGVFRWFLGSGPGVAGRFSDVPGLGPVGLGRGREWEIRPAGGRRKKSGVGEFSETTRFYREDRKDPGRTRDKISTTRSGAVNND